jgi:hypothetical protein
VPEIPAKPKKAMVLTINNKKFDIHFDLSLIKLGDFIRWYDKYGRDLDKSLKEIIDRDYKKHLKARGFTDITNDDIEIHREVDLDNHLDQEALAWFSFWTNFDFFEAKSLPEITSLLYQYRIFRHVMEESMRQTYYFPEEIEWNGDIWKVEDYQVTPQSEMTFNEVITSKEVMRQVYAIGKGKWDAMPYLCCLFFRKKGEQFSDELISEGGERMRLMLELPMSHVMQVAFFLTVCVATWKNTLAFSNEAEVETASQK